MLFLDVLESFIQLVAKRLESMATDYPINEEAQEVAKNWFYKIMSISEVIPRFYIQCAFMKFHEYHTEFKTVDTFDILSATVRGMGNPLLAASRQT